jgi:ComF family protein
MNKKCIVDFLSYVVFTNRCKLCGEVIDRHSVLCENCRNGGFYIGDEICPLCGFSATDCICRGKKNSYSSVCAPYYYEDGAKAAVLRMKYKLREETADYLAERMAECVRKHYADIEFDEIAFVPQTKKQKRTRGLNQSEMLAAATGRRLSLPVRSYLVKLSDNKPQHTLKESLRSGNVLGVFDLNDNECSPEGKTVLLCDDVKTTGATLNECAKMLKLYGAKDVRCVTAAITKKQVDKSK